MVFDKLLDELSDCFGLMMMLLAVEEGERHVLIPAATTDG